MKLVGLMPVRNEAWCLGLSARVALTWCDYLVIGLHACTDQSDKIAYQIATEYPNRVNVLHIDDPKWAEMEHRQDMLAIARHDGATHIAMIDADEILTGNLACKKNRSECAKCAYTCVRAATRDHILQLPLYNLRGGIDRYHSNGLWGKRIVSVAFADDPALHWSGDRFHSREPQGKRLTGFEPVAQGDGGVMHLWASSLDRCRAKHRLYRITERIRWPEKDVRDIERMYGMWEKGSIGEDPKAWTFSPVPEAWWAPYAAWMKYLDVDAPNWQDAECERLIAQHGREYFKGLSI